MRILARTLVAVFLLMGATAVPAQITEAAVAFDSTGKIRTMTPLLVGRMELTAPAWPVTGEFIEARLFQSSIGEYVLVVERAAGRFERIPMSVDHVTALRFAINAATGPRASPVDAVPLPPEPEIVLTWLVRLRWLAAGGQILATTAAQTLFGLGIAVTPMTVSV